MKKLEAIYPPLAAAFPVLAVFSANLTICPLRDLWQPLGMAVSAGALIWLIAGLVFRNANRGAAAATVVIAALFLYGIVNEFCFRNLLPTMPIWGVATFLLAGLAGWKWRWHRLLSVVSVFLVLSSVGSILFGYARIARNLARVAPPRTPGSTGSEIRPDIYYIILDGYGRSDQLKRVMGFDNTPFLTELEKRGFYIAPESHSNYVQTELSLASSLNVDFIPALLPRQPHETEDRSPLDEISSHNAVARYLRSIGYEYVAITTGFPSLQFEDADLHLGRPHRMSLLASTLAAMTPIAGDGRVFDSEYDDRRQMLRAAFANLQTVATSPGIKPRFVFVHILAPHPPFVFNADGSPRPRPHGGFGYWDGSDFYASGNTRTSYRDGYVSQLQFIDAETLTALDTILARPGTKPIILVQGDHGSKLGLDQNSLAKTDIVECMSNLMAYEVPDVIRAKLYPEITPVNSFRTILSTLFGADLPNKPDRSWYSTFDHPYDFQEVTGQLREKPSAKPTQPAVSRPRPESGIAPPSGTAPSPESPK